MIKNRIIINGCCLLFILLGIPGCDHPPPQEADPTHDKTSPVPSETTAPPTKTPEPSATPEAVVLPAEIEILFIDNAGFLITSGGKKILIDAVYESTPYGSKPPSRTIRQMVEGKPPFDEIDLVLITHQHADHFTADLMAEFMQNHPETVLVSTPAVVDRLVSQDDDLLSRMHSIELSPGEKQQISIAEIGLEAFYISHGDPELLNLGFLVTLTGGRLFHTGDLVTETVSVDDLIAYGLAEKPIDVVFAPLYMFQDETYHDHLKQGFRAEYFVPMHFPHKDAPQPEQIQENFPETIIFRKSMQSWTYSPKLQ